METGGFGKMPWTKKNLFVCTHENIGKIGACAGMGIIGIRLNGNAFNKGRFTAERQAIILVYIAFLLHPGIKIAGAALDYDCPCPAVMRTFDDGA
jgi:hypothetical protein